MVLVSTEISDEQEHLIIIEKNYVFSTTSDLDTAIEKLNLPGTELKPKVTCRTLPETTKLIYDKESYILHKKTTKYIDLIFKVTNPQSLDTIIQALHAIGIPLEPAKKEHYTRTQQ